MMTGISSTDELEAEHCMLLLYSCHCMLRICTHIVCCSYVLRIFWLYLYCMLIVRIYTLPNCIVHML